MLSGLPLDVDRWDCETYEVVLFHLYVSLLCKAILEGSAKPGVREAGDVYGCCGYEIVPLELSALARACGNSTLCLPRCERVVAVPEKDYHKNDDGKEMRCLEKLVAEMSSLYQSFSRCHLFLVALT